MQQLRSRSFKYRVTFILARVFLHVLEALYDACGPFFDSPVTFDSRDDSQAKYMSFCKVCTSLILQSLLDVAYFIALFSNAIIA
jgi:hypothetical protein